MANIAGKLERLRSERSSDPVVGIGLRAMLEDPGRGREAQHIVDDRRFAEQACDRGQRRFDADLPALSLQAFQQRRFFAADIGAGAEPRLEIESVAGSEHARTEQPSRPRPLDRSLEGRERMRILGADIDVAFGRADRDACDGHAFDQEEGIALHQHPVGERAAVAFVSVADNVLLVGFDPGARAPFDASRKARPTAPAQARGENLLDRRLRTQAPMRVRGPEDRHDGGNRRATAGQSGRSARR